MRDWTYPYPSLGLFWYVELFTRELALTRKDIVLDAGVGTGHVAYLLSRRVQSLVGVDVSKAQVELLERLQTGRPNLRFLCADVTSARFHTEFRECFDKVYSGAVMEHVEDPRDFVYSICSVLKPGGKAVIHFPNFSWHGCTHFDDVADVRPLFTGLPVSWKIYVAQHTLWGDFVENVYNLARSFYKRVKRLPSNDELKVNVFEETSYFGSLKSTRHVRLGLAGAMYVLRQTTRVAPSLRLCPVADSINNRIIHIQIHKDRVC